MALTMDFRDSTFDDFNRPKLDICPNIQKKHSSGEQHVLMVIVLLNNAHNIRAKDFGDMPLEIIYPKGAHLLILTDQNWMFVPIYRKSTVLESKSFWW